MSSPNQAGKGDRNRATPKAFRAGYEGIDWGKKPQLSTWRCIYCSQPIASADFTGDRAFIINDTMRPAFAAHRFCSIL